MITHNYLFIFFLLASAVVADLKELTTFDHSVLRARPPGVTESFDCQARILAYQYAQQIQPWRGSLESVFDALQLSTLCNQTYFPDKFPVPRVGNFPVPEAGSTFYVDANKGSDSNSGSISAPFKTIPRAIQASRDASGPSTILLRAGTFYLTETINLGSQDSGLTISNYNGELAEINGGILLKPTWQTYDVSKSRNIWVADLSGQGLKEATGLQLNGNRCIRAKYPNGNPELLIYPEGWIMGTEIWSPPAPHPAATTYTVANPYRTDITMFQHYTIGNNGNCVNFEPAESYWCSADRNGGGPDIYHVPTAVQYQANTFDGREWQSPKGAIVHAWQNDHWENWMFEIDQYSYKDNFIGWSYGGFQGARGCLCTYGNSSTYGGQWYVDGIFEELDAPDEFFYNSTTQKLYLFYNGTGAPPADSIFVATNLQVLINVTGTQQKPATHITLQGLKFQNAAYTYMEPHGVPSGGDWALQRSGAVFFEGTENIVVNGSLFERLDGNGLMLSGYNRYASIVNSEFMWIGDTAMAAWGYTNQIDGTSGSQPRETLVSGNMVHELGHYTKQASAWFQGKTAQTRLVNNIFFNGPRAGINFNDGFGGANEITENLLFNQCRESSDHGPFNSWDREPFLTEINNGTASLTPAYNEIHHNFFLCNYGSTMCVDNDDGSSYYKIHDNFEVYGGHKSDFGGHNKFTYNSVVAFARDYTQGLCGGMEAGVPGFVDGYYNNTCVQGRDIPYLDLPGNVNKIDEATSPVVWGNKVYNSAGYVTINVGGTHLNDTEWQQKGQDVGTKGYPMASDEQIIAWGRAVLGMK